MSARAEGQGSRGRSHDGARGSMRGRCSRPRASRSDSLTIGLLSHADLGAHFARANARIRPLDLAAPSRAIAAAFRPQRRVAASMALWGTSQRRARGGVPPPRRAHCRLGRERGRQLSRTERAGQSDGAIVRAPRRQAGRPRRGPPRSRRRRLCRAVRALEGGRGLRSPRRQPSGRSHPVHPLRRRGDAGRHASQARRPVRRRRHADAGPRRPARGSRRTRRCSACQSRARRRRALLCPLHIGHDRPPQGRRDRASEHLQLRAGRGRALRLRSGRPRLSGHVGRLRFLDRGNLGSAGRRRDARSQYRRNQPLRRGARRLPRIARRHLLLLRADAARLDRARAAEAARPS